jgi:hypothetical protein
MSTLLNVESRATVALSSCRGKRVTGGIPVADDHTSTPVGDAPAVLAAVSQHAARSFGTVREAIDATLEVMRDLLNMEVRMVNQVEADRHTFTRLQLPSDLPELEGASTPLNHNF